MRDEVAAAEARKEFLLGNYEEVDGPLPTKCWEWQRGVDGEGYGKINYKGHQYEAHRLAWIIVNGPIPKGLHCLHRCDNRLCVNVKHLFVDTNARNVEDMIEKGRQARGELHGMAIFSDAEASNIKGLLQGRLYGLGAELARRYSAIKKRDISIATVLAVADGWQHIEPSPNPVMPRMPGLKINRIKRRKGL